MTTHDEIIGSVFGRENGQDVPVLLLVVRGDRAGFVFEAGGADFFEITEDGPAENAVESALERAQVARAARGRRPPRRGGRRPRLSLLNLVVIDRLPGSARRVAKSRAKLSEILSANNGQTAHVGA